MSVKIAGVVIILTACLQTGCQKALHFPPDDPTLIPARTVKDVYVAGFESNGAHQVAKYWKNGVAVPLTDGSHDSYAWAISIAGNDVYVAGAEISAATGRFVVTYWKNGTAVPLTDGSYDGSATAIAVSGNDVHLAGYVNSSTGNTVKYWKNGSASSLSIIGRDAQAFCMVVSGTDVYVSGYQFNGTNDVALYWRNNNPLPLSSGTEFGYSTG
ncbi:MAG TPA: hypothetical protein VGM41_07200, partial [Chitinophagaceae bacterium]